jgi:hypothetical protein
MLRSVLIPLALLAATAASATESDYTLACGREIVDARRATSRPAGAPVSAKVHFTGTTTSRTEADGARTRYADLVLSISGSRMKGGAVEGSNFDSSTTYDGAFERTGEGSTVWAFSRDFRAFTLRHGGRWYVCSRS